MDIPALIDQFMPIGVYILALLLIWGAIRLVLNITKKVFQFGCLAIVLLGAGLIFLQVFGGS
jgi:hypothetical protein